MTAPKPGDVRLWRMRKHLGEWTLKTADLIEAVRIVDSLTADGFPDGIQIQRYGGDDHGWYLVPADDLEVARNTEERVPRDECTFCDGTGLDDRDDGFYWCPVCGGDPG